VAALSNSSIVEDVAAALGSFFDKNGNLALRGPSAKTAASLWILAQRLLEEFGIKTLKINPIMAHVKGEGKLPLLCCSSRPSQLREISLYGVRAQVPKYVGTTDRACKENVYKFCVEVWIWTRSLELATAGMEIAKAVGSVG
jgi:hypothetical protein